jgi:uncharacterized protein YdgA (DUF945 family)
VKKIVIVVVVLVALLAVAPWGVGKVAEKRLDHGLDKLVEAAPYLTVVERKYTPGWFKSEQVVTFEAFGPWMKALSPKALEDAMTEAAESADGDVEAEEKLPGDDEAPVPEDIPAPDEPMRFTVRNEVLHGPVLGLAGFGIARVDSHLVLDETIRKEIEETFGPKTPLEVSTRIGFLGGGTTTFKSEGRTISPKDSKSEISWETFKLAVGYSSNLDKYDLDGKWPKLEVTEKNEGFHFVMTDMSMDGDGKRVRGDLYDGDFNFVIDKISFVGQDKQKVEVSNAHYLVNSETKGEFTSISAKMGVGEVKAKELKAQGIELKEVHYDFSVRRLHAETLEKIMASMKAAYGRPLANNLEVNDIMFAPLKEHGIELLKYDPEFVIDRVGIVTPEGDGYIKGVVTLKGATAEDFGTGTMSLIGKVQADITIDVSEKMIQKFPNGSTGAGAAVDSGYAKREGERLICKILFKDGELTVNGKPQAIPGLGGPPPGGEAEVPPPQE